MTDLTEQWKKGEQTDGFYLIEFKYCEILPTTFSSMHGFIYCDSLCDDENIKQILEEMPSYEEWKASENYIGYLKQCISVYESKEKQHVDDAVAYNELAEENKDLKEILERHKKATAKAQIRSLDLEIINKKLKELLEECKPFIELYNYTPENKRLLEQIVEQIGEE